MRNLNVKKTSKVEVEQKWKTELPTRTGDILYIRCNAKGVINWNIAPVYTPVELIERGDYTVLL